MLEFIGVAVEGLRGGWGSGWGRVVEELGRAVRYVAGTEGLPLDGGEDEGCEEEEDAKNPEDEKKNSGVGGVVFVGFEDAAGEESEDAQEDQEYFGLADPEAGEFETRGGGFVEDAGDGVEDEGGGDEDEGPGAGGFVEDAVEGEPEEGRGEEGGKAADQVVEESGAAEGGGAAHGRRD